MFGWASVESTSTSVPHASWLAASAHSSGCANRLTATGAPLESTPLNTEPEPPAPSSLPAAKSPVAAASS
eukprot:4640856-Prymnesium_polylepis.1